MVVPGARAVTVGAGREWGLSLATPVIVKYRDEKTDARTELEGVAALSLVDLARALDRHRLDHRPRGRRLLLARRLPARARLPRHRAAGRGTAGQPARLPRPEPGRRALDSRRLRAAVPPEPASRAGGCTAAGACDAKGILAAQVTAVERLRESGEEPRRPAVRRRGGAGQRRRGRGRRDRAGLAAFLVGRRAHGQPPRPRDPRGLLRLKLKAAGRAAHSSQPQLRDLGHRHRWSTRSWRLRAPAAARGPGAGADVLHVGLIAGGIAPNVISPSAEAELIFRTVGPGRRGARAPRAAARRGSRSSTCSRCRRCGMRTLPGFDTAVFAVHHRHPAAGELGRAAALRPRLDPARAHGRRARRDRRARGGRGRVRADGDRAAAGRRPLILRID